MPAFPAPALRSALAAAATTAALLTGCGVAESDTDRLGRKVATDAVDAADSQPLAAPATASPTASTPAPDPTASPAPQAQLLRNPARQVRPSIAPADGTRLGIGQPVALVFKGQKVDPALRAGVEGRVAVKTSTGVVGA